MSVLSAPYMHDEAAAFAHVEAMLWPAGPVCPKCGVIGEAYELKGVRSKPSKKRPEGKERHGLRKCKACGRQFTVRTGTIFEESHIDLHLWLQAICLMTGSEGCISANQLHRTLGITLKSAWLMGHRIRAAMRDDGTVNFGSGGGEAEVDETFTGLDKSETGRARRPEGRDAHADPAGQHRQGGHSLHGRCRVASLPSPAMSMSATARASTVAARCAPTPSRAVSASSSAA